MMEELEVDFPAMKPNKYPWNDEVMKVLEMEPYTVTHRSPEGVEFKFNEYQMSLFLIEMWGKLDGWTLERKGTFIPIVRADGNPNLPCNEEHLLRLCTLMSMVKKSKDLKL